jgi:hypothetical protein
MANKIGSIYFGFRLDRLVKSKLNFCSNFSESVKCILNEFDGKTSCKDIVLFILVTVKID